MSPCQCPMTDLQVSHLLCIPAPHGIFHIHDPGNAGDKSRCIPQHQLTRGGHTADPVHLDVEPGFWVSRSLLGHVQFSSVTQSCPSLCDPMDCSTPGFPVHHYSQSLLKLMSIELVMPSNHLILCHPLFLLPSIFPSFRIFSKDSVLRIRWPKYWSFSFSISPSKEYSGLISFGWTCWISLQSKGLSGVFSNKSINFSVLSFLYSPTLTSIHDYWKNHSFD